jgi:hypothetical protein
MRSPEKRGCCGGAEKSVLQQRFIAPDPALEESFDEVKN